MVKKVKIILTKKEQTFASLFQTVVSQIDKPRKIDLRHVSDRGNCICCIMQIYSWGNCICQTEVTVSVVLSQISKKTVHTDVRAP